MADLNDSFWRKSQATNGFPVRSSCYGHVAYNRSAEYGNPLRASSVNSRAAFRRGLWRNLQVGTQFETRCSAGHNVYGGIFGLEFSPDGSMLVAACEQQSLLVFDSLNHRLVSCIPKAHHDCVNTVRFLSNHVFASGSDDTTVRLWDLRFLKSHMRTFHGHTHWVKNIEYIPESGMLLTSAFDGYVFCWDINRWDDSSDEPEQQNFGQNQNNSDSQSRSAPPRFTRIFYAPDLMRMRLTPNNDKMIVSTQWGYLVVIHDFDLPTACEDLASVKPTNYWLVRKYGAVQSIESGEERLRRFNSRTRNRPEIILDFPTDDVETISALCPHPQGWCVVTRYSYNAENREYTCVHDIQWPPVARPLLKPPNLNQSTATFVIGIHDSTTGTISVPSSPSSQSGAAGSSSAQTGFSGSASTLTGSDDSPHQTGFSIAGAGSTARAAGSGSNNFDESSDGDDDEFFSPPSSSGLPLNYFLHSPASGHVITMSSSNTTTAPPSSQQNLPLPLPFSPQNGGVPPPCPRLTHYIEEPVVGRGFVKEPAFSADGCLIASPYGFGIRLLTFDKQVNELCDSPSRLNIFADSSSSRDAATIPVLEELDINSNLFAHVSPVLCTKFSPTHPLLVSGSLGGKLAFCQPVL